MDLAEDDLLVRYFTRLEERGLGEWVDKSIPGREVFDEISNLRGLTIEEAARRLAEKLTSTVVPEVAEEVVGLGRAASVWAVARRLALWYIQLAVELGVVEGRKAESSR